MAALEEVIERKGRFCALYSDRASHFLETPKAGRAVDRGRLTQVGRALKELGIQMIPSYSPQTRGRGERRFGTWQGRLPQDLRLAGMRTVEEANQFLRNRHILEISRRLRVPAAEKGHAFVPVRGQDLDRIFSVQHERVVANDNTVKLGEQVWQLERTCWRGTLAGCRVTIREYLDGRATIPYGPHLVGRHAARGAAPKNLAATRGAGSLLTKCADCSPECFATVERAFSRYIRNPPRPPVPLDLGRGWLRSPP
jgi:hypothetical protein